MKIISDDSKILEQVFEDLTNKSLNVEVIEKTPEKGAQVTGIEIAGLIIGSVGTIIAIVSYLENLEKEGYFVFFKKDEIKKITLSEFQKLNKDEQRQMVNDDTIIIEK